MIQQKLFQKRLKAAKQLPQSTQGSIFKPPNENFPNPPYIVRGIPSDALNYRLRVRLDEPIMIYILQGNGRAMLFYGEVNQHHEFFPTDRVLDGNG